MARTLTEIRMTTRSARRQLPIGIHWRGIDIDVHLGYRKSARGGQWVVRWYVGDRKYRQITLGIADDVMDVGTLSYEDAHKRARATVAGARGAGNLEAPITIRDVVTDYIRMRDARASAQAGRPVKSDASSRLGRYVLEDAKFGRAYLAEASEEDLLHWRGALPATLKASTRFRLINDLKAALNAAAKIYRKRLPADMVQTIKHGLSIGRSEADVAPVARENQILTDDQVCDIINAAFEHDPDGDLGRMILLLAATGARFSQARRMLVGDVQREKTRVMIPASRKGQGRQGDHIPVQVGSDVLDELISAIEGRNPGEPLLCRWRHVQISPTEWQRVDRRPWQSASELTRAWKAICDQLKLTGIVPYALRHSSIVRAIRTGLPIRLVASVHDTSVVMIERHYSRWIADGLEELAARAVIPLIGGGEAAAPQAG